MPSRRRFTGLLISLVPLLLHQGTPTRADSWATPTTKKVPSANGRYTALVIPAELGRARADRQPPRVHVYEGEPGAEGKWETLWAVELTNPVAPVSVMLTDDARYLVTHDEWHSVGRGPDTVAFYARDGDAKTGRQLARYALEDFLTKDEQQRVQWSVSSTWWLRHGHAFLDEWDDAEAEDRGAGDGGAAAAGRYFCAWLGECGRWAAWDVTTGRQIELGAADDPRVRRWTERLRPWALRHLEGGDNADVTAGLRFLAAARDPRDRPLLEGQLGADDCRVSRRVADGKLSAEVESETRAEADRALAAWDGRPVAGGRQWEGPWQYQRLGTLEVAVPVVHPGPAPAPAKKRGNRKAARGEGDGFGAIYLYLVPEGTGEADLIAQPPVHRARISFGRDVLDRAAAEGVAADTVHVRFLGVTPGRYRIWVVQDRAAPFHSDAAKTCDPSVGDFQGTSAGVVEINAGETTVAEDTPCTEPVLATG